MNYFRILLILVFSLSIANAQQPYADKLAHTYSIVARDAKTGEMGVAVQSHWFSVGSIVSWAESGVGAIATQSFVNPSFGPRGLILLKQGLDAETVLNLLIESDDGRDVRQLAIVDSEGRTAAYTGKKCIPAAGHIVGDGFSVQANLMANDKVWPAMEKAFQSTKGDLAERMMAALEAAQGQDGDIRGKQSAAMLIVNAKPTGRVWEDRKIDLRIEDHPTPIKEMRRLLTVHRAYQHMNRGDVAIEKNDIETAKREYGLAEKMFPANLEMKYWHAVSLANVGEMNSALPLFKVIFSQDENWRELTKRLPSVDLLTVSASDLKKILAQ